MKTGIIIKPKVWLYDEDKKNVIDELFMGWAVGIMKEESGLYYLVTHYGYRGWLQKDALHLCPEKNLRLRDESGRMVYMKGMFVDVMQAPSVHSKILCTLSRGSFVEILPDIENGYRRIRLANGLEGYVPCVVYSCRRENDGYLYFKNQQNYFLRYFLRQKQNYAASEKSIRANLVFCAKSYLGTQYRWAGKTAEGIDCSGLTFMCYLMNGILIYRDAKIKEGYPVHPINKEEIGIGDLLYFPGHIAMYIGNGKYIHATGNEKSFGCVINSLWEQDMDYREDLANSILAVGSIF